MVFWKTCQRLLHRSPPYRSSRKRVLSTGRLRVAALEERLCPSSGSLVVASYDNNMVLRYNESTGAFVDQIDSHNLANLKGPVGTLFGLDHNLYVSDRQFDSSAGNLSVVLQYNGTSGAFQTVFASQHLTSPRGVLFGPDGDLYVANGSTGQNPVLASVERFDGKTGAFLDDFVAPGSGGIEHPAFMVFGPDGNLYVDEAHAGSILRYYGPNAANPGAPDPTPGQSGAIFVPPASGGLDAPQGMVFGPDGNIYVASMNAFNGSNGPQYSGDFPPGAVLTFQGPSGPNPGAFLGTFIPAGSGGLANPEGVLFGPDGDLYVSSCAMSNLFTAIHGTSQVLRYEGTTGAFLGTFVTPDSGGLRCPISMVFSETDPTTLSYDGGQAPTSASTLLSQIANTPPSSSGIGTASQEMVPILNGSTIPLALLPQALPPVTATSRSMGPSPSLIGRSSDAVAKAADATDPVRQSQRHAGTPAELADEVFANLDAAPPFAGLADDLVPAGWGPNEWMSAPGWI